MSARTMLLYGLLLVLLLLVAMDFALPTYLLEHFLHPVLTTELCSDGMLNANESDVDCGGGRCRECRVGQRCRGDGDCEHGFWCGISSSCLAVSRSISPTTTAHAISPASGFPTAQHPASLVDKPPSLFWQRFNASAAEPFEQVSNDTLAAEYANDPREIVRRGVSTSELAQALNLHRLICKLRAGNDTHILAIGGSNTAGRIRPFYFEELEIRLNLVFDGHHKVSKIGRGGCTTSCWMRRFGGFDEVRRFIVERNVDAVIVESEYNDAVIAAKRPQVELANLEAVDHLLRTTGDSDGQPLSVAYLGLTYPWCDVTNPQPRHRSGLACSPAASSKSINMNSADDWLRAEGPSCWEEQIDSDGQTHNVRGQDASTLECRQLFQRPFHVCFGSAFFSLHDALVHVAAKPAWRAHLAPPDCRPGVLGNSPALRDGSAADHIGKDASSRVLSGDQSGHVGGWGLRMAADGLVAMILTAMDTLETNAQLECATGVVPAKHSENIFHYASDRAHLNRMVSGFEIHLDGSLPVFEMGNGWILCRHKAFISKRCKPNGAWIHAELGRYHEYAKSELSDEAAYAKMKRAKASENLTFAFDIFENSQNGNVVRQNTTETSLGYSVLLGYVRSSFPSYGSFRVHCTVTDASSGEERLHSIADLSGFEADLGHTLPISAVITTRLPSDQPMRVSVVIEPASNLTQVVVRNVDLVASLSSDAVGKILSSRRR